MTSERPPELLLTLALAIRTAGETGIATDHVAAALADDVDAAYAIQTINTEHSLTARRLVGRKIGLTNPVVQQQLGVDQPDFGVLFADMAEADAAVIAPNRVMQPRVEAEMAFVLGADLVDPEVSIDEVRSAVRGVRAALEICGTRYHTWTITITDTIADNASSGAYVLGEREVELDSLDLTGAAMAMTRNGEIVSSGTGAACFGSPLVAAQWLAREVARRGRPLRRGEIVLTGALGQMVAALPGDHFSATIDGLGTVECSFATE